MKDPLRLSAKVVSRTHIAMSSEAANVTLTGLVQPAPSTSVNVTQFVKSVLMALVFAKIALRTLNSSRANTVLHVSARQTGPVATVLSGKENVVIVALDVMDHLTLTV